jgi:hypothetical protein
MPKCNPVRTTTNVTILKAGSIKRIHVYGQRIRSYNKTGDDLPCFIVKCKGKTYHGRMVSFRGNEVRGMQDLKHGMPGCRHAKVWLQTTGAVFVYKLEAIK